jgi:hypothetical protein
MARLPPNLTAETAEAILPFIGPTGMAVRLKPARLPASDLVIFLNLTELYRMSRFVPFSEPLIGSDLLRPDRSEVRRQDSPTEA